MVGVAISERSTGFFVLKRLAKVSDSCVSAWRNLNGIMVS